LAAETAFSILTIIMVAGAAVLTAMILVEQMIALLLASNANSIIVVGVPEKASQSHVIFSFRITPRMTGGQ